MTISTPNAPATALPLIRNALAHLSLGSANAHVLAFAADAPAAQASQPLRLYVLQLDDIADPNFLAKAKPVGWRYLIVRGEPVAFADIKQLDPVSGLVFSRLVHGSVAQRLAAAAAVSAQSYQQSAEAFEARILEIPALYEAALWLHGARDVFIPFVRGVESDAPPQEDPEFIQRILSQKSGRSATDSTMAP